MHWVAHKGRIGGYQREVVNLLRGGVTGDSSSNHLRELGMSSWLGGLFCLRGGLLSRSSSGVRHDDWVQSVVSKVLSRKRTMSI